MVMKKGSASPYEWEKPHSTFVKGFGSISTYFVRGSHVPPPKDLLTRLNIEPYLGYMDFTLGGSV